LADYRDHYDAIGAAGADVVALSVDPPERSEALRRALRVPFPILSDAQHRLVRDWDIYNPRERGGIARHAVFIIDPGRTVRYSQVDSMATRVPASEILRMLGTPTAAASASRKVYIPALADFIRSFRNWMS
jgi:peroxiredoxin